MTREFYIDGAGVTPGRERCWSEGLAHAFPIRTGGSPRRLWGQAGGDFVVAAEVCAASEIARVLGL